MGNHYNLYNVWFVDRLKGVGALYWGFVELKECIIFNTLFLIINIKNQIIQLARHNRF